VIEGNPFSPLCKVSRKKNGQDKHTHYCADCSEGWSCEDADCEPRELQKRCNHCRQASLREDGRAHREDAPLERRKGT
jgi:hypothetical protein